MKGCSYESGGAPVLVECPPDGEILVVDLQEGLSGATTVLVDGKPLLTGTFGGPSLTGLFASVRVRPARWPAVVRIKNRAGDVEKRVPQATRFVGVRTVNGRLAVTPRAEPFGYE